MRDRPASGGTFGPEYLADTWTGFAMTFSMSRIGDTERRRFSDIMVAAVAASLPWSTSATGILIAIWLVSLIGVLKPADIRAELRTPAGALPAVLWALAALSLLWSEASWAARLEGFNPITNCSPFRS